MRSDETTINNIDMSHIVIDDGHISKKYYSNIGLTIGYSFHK
jgi:hypothetical protein